MFKKLNYILVSLAFVICCCQNNTSSSDHIKKISLAEWSLHRALQKGEIDHLDFPRIAVNNFGIHTLEYVSQFFQDKASDLKYLQQLKDSCQRYGAKSLMIMIDNEGYLGDTVEDNRVQAVENHIKWLRTAKFLGCESIRVNGVGLGSDKDIKTALIRSLSTLGAIAEQKGIHVLVENHGMMMPNGSWSMKSFATNGQKLSNVLNQVDNEYVGALPDFGNFDDYDRYQGVEDLLPYAYGISAKSHEFDENGEEIHTDYAKMFELIREDDFDGYVGIEYDALSDTGISEYEGIQKTKELILKYR